MLETFQNLKKILQQEQKLNYQDKAVIGGLKNFANNWLKQALAEATTKAERLQIEQVVSKLKSYSGTAAEARPERINEIIAILDSNVSVPAPKQTQPKRKPPKEPAPANKTQASADKPAQPRVSRQKSRDMALGLDAPVTRLPGIRRGYGSKLEKLGVTTIGDLLTHFPHRYEDYRTLKTIHQLTYGEEVTIIAQIWQTITRKLRGNRTLIETTLSDGTGTIRATWFNQPWLEKSLTAGKQIVLSGQVGEHRGHLTFQSPAWEYLDTSQVHTARLVPIYPLTSGITNQWLRKLQKQTIDYWAERLDDFLPESVRQRQSLVNYGQAIAQIHFPDDWEQLEAARRRLAFDELMMIQLGVFRQRRNWRTQPGEAVDVDDSYVEQFIAALPFNLTNAQQNTLKEILADLSRPVPMSRMLQGDVGSGKTVVALAAMLAVIRSGGQAAIIAPTEILAEQHYKSMSNLLALAGLSDTVTTGLLTGSTKTKERRTTLAQLAAGEIQLLIGTHAIIQKNIDFQNLKLAVVDEQHRFGVEQRGLLRQKGNNPHMLVMSATPIPRSLALTLYGDLDLSIIDEMPAGRKLIKTHWLRPLSAERAYSFIQSEIDKGRQAFIICPLVEESDKIEAKSAVEEHKRLQEKVFPHLKLGLLHGRMKAKEKDRAMADFRDHHTDILVSTSVVEVGIDIPNASTILIEGANRFGLAQLHQFRGRVGRGEDQGYCILLSDSTSPEAEARLNVMVKTNNGFTLAEEDLKIRGPGEFFGTRQSGLPSLKMVKLSDTKLLEQARTEARQMIDADPDLKQPQHQALSQKTHAFWARMTDPS